MATKLEQEVDKWRKEARDWKKRCKSQEKENEELSQFNSYLTKKILRLTDEEEKTMYLTTKLNELNKLSIDQKLKQVHDGNTSRENK
jgi:hypothetical protein